MRMIWAGLAAALLWTGAAFADVTGHWLRHAAVSPDGSQIVFSAHGQLWRVSADGGIASPITTGEGWSGHPAWSPDGSMIAFANDRFGNLDVFVMRADGLQVSRLTFHSADDRPSDFSPDGQRVLFSSARGASAQSAYFPTGALPELYEIAVTGGAPRMVSTVPGNEARWSPDGTRIAYRQERAYENSERQRDVSSFARDIWVMDVATGEHENVSVNPGGDHAPVWADDGSLLLLSEIDGGAFNVHHLDLETGRRTVLTDHGPHPARDLSVSRDGLAVYTYHGDIYRVRRGEAAQRLGITLSAPPLRDAPRPFTVAGRITEFAVSPDGKELAFVARGEVFVTAADFSTTVRLTDTAEQERSVSFSPDGRSVLYASNRDGAWAIYETSLTDASEPRFSAATAWNERLVYRQEGGEAFQPAYSPDGELIAFIDNRDAVSVVTRQGRNRRTVFGPQLNYSYSDGDIGFSWSPDSRWIASSFTPGNFFYPNIGIAPADGSAPPRDITLTGYGDYSPQWHEGGGAIVWISNRFGPRSHGSWGAQQDVMAGFLTQSAWDRFNLTEQERALAEEMEEGEENGETDGALADFFNWIGAALEGPTQLDVDAVEHRTRRLTIHSSELADARLNSDLTQLYYLARFEGGFDLWMQDLTKGETRRIAQLNARSASLQLADDSTAFVLVDGNLRKIVLPAGTVTPVAITAEVSLRADSEREHLFEHVWRQVEDKFYDPDFHGVDWPAMRAAYEPKLAGVSTSRDFALLMSEMLGQLNASHTGMRFRPQDPGNVNDSTASLGVIYDLTAAGPGLVIAEILPGGPLDRDGFDIRPGARITAIAGTALEQGVNPFSLLNRRTGQRIRITIEPARGGRARELTVRPYSQGQEAQARYERWIEQRRALVEEASGGRIGYAHIRSMNDTGYRQVYGELLGRNFHREAVVIDTRFNGGGWLHDDLLTLLTGEDYFRLRARDRIIRGAPEERWSRPSAVVMNEGNYSNAHMFPFVYQLFGVGPLVGMPVPGTGTAVWWETLMTGDLVFGIPQLPVLDPDDRPVENQELQPDIRVDNPPAQAARGEDAQLQAAVQALLDILEAQE
jgi:tricorn protease